MIGHKIISLSVVDSTNNYVAKLLQADEIEHGAVILAENQNNGRGQRGTEWQSEPGKNLIFSFLLSDVDLSVMDQFRLNQLTSVALINTLKKLDIDAKIKWPNDIYVNDSKISGMLIENSISGSGIKESIVGIGLNINQTDFEGFKATSLKLVSGSDQNIHSVLFSFIYEFNELFDLLDFPDRLKELYMKNLLGVKEPVRFSYNGDEFIGNVHRIDEIGRLELISEDRIHGPFSLKEVSFII